MSARRSVVLAGASAFERLARQRSRGVRLFYEWNGKRALRVRRGHVRRYLLQWEANVELFQRVLLTRVGGLRVSTVFLAVDHSFRGSRPVLWETMVFDEGNSTEHRSRRYASFRAAREGHRQVVAGLRRVSPRARPYGVER